MLYFFLLVSLSFLNSKPNDVIFLRDSINVETINSMETWKLKHGLLIEPHIFAYKHPHKLVITLHKTLVLLCEMYAMS